MVQLAIENLSHEQLTEAWPVVRMSRSHANADWWTSEAAELMRRGGGVIAARAADGTIHGVATYEVSSKALLGRVIVVDTLITFELSRRAPARHALCEALELLASAFDCRSIILPLPSTGYGGKQANALYGLVDFQPPPDLA